MKEKRPRRGSERGKPSARSGDTAAQPTTPDKAIDPGRSTLGKSLLNGTGAFGCERQHWYEERVRLPNGWRVQRLMPEKVHFGKAVDVAHAQAVRWLVDGAELGDVQERVPRLVEMGYYAGLAEQPWADDKTGEPYDVTPDDREVFAIQIGNALALLTGLAPNNVPDQYPQPAEKIPLLQVPLPGIHIQGMDGQTLQVPGVFNDRALGATPDYVYTEGGLLTAWLDVKCVDRAYTYPQKWHGAEATIYTYALLRLNEGVAPDWIGYQEYRRNVKPYWIMTQRRQTAQLARLAERYVLRWDKALESDDPDMLQFNTRECAKCVFRQAVPDTTHTGCPIGQAVADIGMGKEE